jgi:predicted TIM-barrel fold metal-dependent hydrolase
MSRLQSADQQQQQQQQQQQRQQRSAGVLRAVAAHVLPASSCHTAGQQQPSPPLDVFDPHFHLFDPTGIHQGTRSDGSAFTPYNRTDYERDMAEMGPGFRHVGGVWTEAMSVCFAELDAVALRPHCLAEASFAAAELRASPLSYALEASAALEDPSVADALRELVAAHPNTRSIRQIANVSPNWPRNAALGDLVDNPHWRRGYSELAKHNLCFCLSTNPWQLPRYVREVVAPNPGVNCIINHLGLPLLADLVDNGGATFWEGMEALARCPHAYIQISSEPAAIESLHTLSDPGIYCATMYSAGGFVSCLSV